MSPSPRLDIEGLNEQQIEAQRCSIVAWDTCRSADCLLDNYPGERFVIPSGIVLRAFALELIIKAGIIAGGAQCPRIHDLAQLFKLLCDSTKLSSIFDFKQKSGSELEHFLVAQKDALIDWRYLHQKRELGCNPEEFRQAFIAIWSALYGEYPEIQRANPVP